MSRIISPHDPALRVMGRIDDGNPDRPVWVFPYTQMSFRFTGTTLSLTVINHHDYGDSRIGVIIDGTPYCIRIPIDSRPVTLTLASHLPDIEHEATIYKRQDGEHYLELLWLAIDDSAEIQPPSVPEPARRIEIYGDSVSAGERDEAVLYAGACDPDVDLSPYSNSWLSYGAIAARKLGAQLHDIAQGGASLLDGIGWFHAPNYIGMESIWDRIEYNPSLGPTRQWDFSRYTPHVVIVAIGQNDSHPNDFMAQEYDGDAARHWRARYADFLRALRGHYPKALIICTTTVLKHDPSWDHAIDETVNTVDDPNIVHFLYSRNGSATPGHPRVQEHEEMANELVGFIRSHGDDIWSD
ncbi:GDSL-type esterase/lipase family protein [Bifidobacterium thermacidophilum]|uniref:GDSL-like Lipase/Acylhydrolase family n=1 Tax=Bifidobacterium thermacidophilum subsp. thermacidophilum TaxID=79262 RepID=A0A087E2J4_9BIFI|nr:GDSL-type esterase/lipase family protein [Bifidobacterium thermacidophilum]KFJ01995.1 GDSL-like Lipase/Acylhydrolase family [Bifidobacterium thermacidophilum subsp. thermacidophilum]